MLLSGIGASASEIDDYIPEVRDRVAVITGASRGIGKAIALRAARVSR